MAVLTLILRLAALALVLSFSLVPLLGRRFLLLLLLGILLLIRHADWSALPLAISNSLRLLAHFEVLTIVSLFALHVLPFRRLHLASLLAFLLLVLPEILAVALLVLSEVSHLRGRCSLLLLGRRPLLLLLGR